MQILKPQLALSSVISIYVENTKKRFNRISGDERITFRFSLEFGFQFCNNLGLRNPKQSRAKYVYLIQTKHNNSSIQIAHPFLQCT